MGQSNQREHPSESGQGATPQVTNGPSGWSTTFKTTDSKTVQVIKVPSMRECILTVEDSGERGLILVMLTKDHAKHVRDMLNSYLTGEVPEGALERVSDPGE